MGKKIDLTGQIFGRLTVIRENGHNQHGIIWLCRCECGKEKNILSRSLRNGRTRSCGCLQRETSVKVGNLNATHGFSGNNRLYRIWKQMRIRCYCKTNPTYMHYGARGIKICKEWEDFAVFRKWSLSNGYDDNLTIERKDVNADYCPENCCWIPKYLQAKNRRTTILYEFDGKKMTQADWARFIGINPATLIERIQKYGLEAALSMKKGERFHGGKDK